MECKTDPKKKRMYQCRLWGLFLGNVVLFAAGCAVMAMGLVPDPFRGLGAIGLAVLACCLFPSSLLLIRGLSLSGTAPGTPIWAEGEQSIVSIRSGKFPITK